MKKIESKIAILLCTCDGEKFLKQQLDSLAHQTVKHWQVIASDDHSKDNTISILNQYQQNWGKARFTYHLGPNLGFVANFLSLACQETIQADYFAFCDQDDIWLSHKLQVAIELLHVVPSHIPALFCSRTKLINEQGDPIGYSPLFTKPPHFANALVQNIGGGNTMVFNQAARLLLMETKEVIQVPSHDWWLYLLVTGCGGRVFYDPNPSILYRQHPRNLVGANISFPATVQRFQLFLQGRFESWNNQHILALKKIYHQLTKENQTILNLFIESRHSQGLQRLYKLYQSRVFRQTLIGNMGLIAAAILGKM